MSYKSTSHLLHLILTVLFFPWAVVWAFCALSNAQHNRKVEMNLLNEQLQEMKRQNGR